MLKKSVIVLLTLTTLSGCGYKGALYIPDAPSQNTPEAPSSPTVDNSSDTTTTLPASTSGEPN